MRTKIFFLLIFVFTISMVDAQFRVLQNGRVQAGLLRDVNEDLGNVTSMQIFGRNGDLRTGSKLSFGDFGQYQNQGWNVFIGEYGSADTDQLWLHGKLGIYLTTNGYASNVVAYYNPSLNSSFIFNTNLRVNGINITSDARLKENISAIRNPLSTLSQIDGVSYTYSLSEMKKNSQQDENLFLDENSKGGIGQTNPALDQSFDKASAEKAIRDKQLQAKVAQKEAEEANRKRIGFLAQDIQKVLPELVQTDESGIMSIDYTGFIPLIVESIKELQTTIEQQNEQIMQLSKQLNSEQKIQTRSSLTGTNDLLDEAKLYNAAGASVAYHLPMEFATAHLQIVDIAGKTVKRFNLEKGSDHIQINSSEIGLGTFIYILVVDNQKRDTLKKYVNR